MEPSGGPPTKAVLLNKEAAPPDSFAPGFIPVSKGVVWLGFERRLSNHIHGVSYRLFHLGRLQAVLYACSDLEIPGLMYV